MAHDVFISYSSKDKAAADAVCHALESRKIRCWIAPRDVLPGKAFEKSIIEAINDARIFILIFSKSSNSSGHVESEVKTAWKKGIPIIPFRIEEVELNDVMGYYISSQHWLDAISRPMEQHLQKLCDSVQTLLNDGKQPATVVPEPPVSPPAAAVPGQQAASPPKRQTKLPVMAIALGLAAIICIGIIAGAAIILLNPGQASPDVPPGDTGASPTPKASPGATVSPGSTVTDKNYYAMFRGNPERTGVYSTNGPVSAPAQKWAFRANASIRSTPAVYNGIVYAGCEDGYFYAVDAATGMLKWKYQAQKGFYGEDQVQSSPAATDGIVYFASHYGNTLYALDAVTGEERWSYALDNGQTSSSPCVADGTVFIASGDGVYAIDAKTGAGKWNYPFTNSVSSSSLWPSVAVADNIVVAVDYDIMIAIDAATGAEQWRYKPDYGFDGSPAISGGNVYIGSEGKVCALSLQSGDLLWKSEYVNMGMMDLDVGVADGKVVKPGLSGTVDAVDVADGRKLWSFPSGDYESFIGGPSFAGDLAYIGNENGYLYALSTKTGMSQWKFKAKDAISSSAAIANGVVYFGSEDHYLYAIG